MVELSTAGESGPWEVVVDGLEAGRTYFARVHAYNAERGFGEQALSEATKVVTLTQPKAPVSPTVSTASGSALRVRWAQPASPGSAVSAYRVEWFQRATQAPYSGVHEVQTATLTSNTAAAVGE